jgi:hypothetical protein
MDIRLAKPLEMTSRSSSVRAKGDRFLGLGRMPPFSVSIRRMEEWYRSNSLAMSCRDSPFCQRSHIKAFWASV